LALEEMDDRIISVMVSVTSIIKGKMTMN